MDVLQIGFGQSRRLAATRLQIGFSQTAATGGVLLQMTFAQQGRIGGRVLDLGFAQIRQVRRRRFKGSQAIGIGDFDLRVTIDGQYVDMCSLAESMSIRHGENESYTCRFVMRPLRDRKQPQPVNPYVWYTRPIVVEAVDDAGAQRLYSGFVDSMGYDMTGGRFEINCTDRREQQINDLPAHIVRGIGQTAKSIHGDLFETQADELEARLETVPASFEFDAHGTPYLTDWREKDVADFVVTPCMIYQRQPVVRLASVGGVTNEVHLELRRSVPRRVQQVLNYQYLAGLHPCQYAETYGGEVFNIDALKSAVAETGWRGGR